MFDNGFSAATLTEREQVILSLAGDGKTDQAIADNIGFAKSTLVNYWTRIRLKLGASSKTEAVAIFKDLKNRDLAQNSHQLSKELEQQLAAHDALRRANAELLEAEARYKAQTRRLAEVIWGTNIATWEWNILTGETEFNNRWAEIIGYTLEELHPISIRTWQQLVHPTDLERSAAILAKCFSKEQDTYECEARMRHKDGRWVWILDRGRVVEWTRDGRPLRMSGIHIDITDRKQAEHALRASEERFRNLSSLVSEGVMIHRDYTILDANDAFASFVGASSINELIGQNCFHLIPLTPDLMATFEKQRLTKERGTYDIEMIMPDGRLFYAEARGEDIVYEGKPARLVSMRDITQRKLAEKCLKEQESNYRTAFETIGDMIFVARFDGQIIYANSAVERKLGFKVSDLIGKPFVSLHPEEDRADASVSFGEMVRGDRDTCPYPLVNKAGESMYVDTRVWLGSWSNEDCVFAVSKDLGPLVEAQQRFEKLFRKNPALMTLTTIPDRRFYDVNDTFLSVLGYSKDEVIGRTSQELGIFVDQSSLDEMASHLHREGSVSGYELSVKSKSGKIFHGLFSAERIVSNGQQHFLTVMVDVTDQKLLEAQVVELHKLEAIGTIAGGIAHDFNNLLAVIQGNAVLARQYAENQEAVSCLSDINSATERAKRLVQQILAFSQDKAEDMQVQPLADLVNDACRFLRSMVPSNVEFVAEVVDCSMSVKCSSTHICQLIVYMCSRAWNELEGREGRVSVKLEAVDVGPEQLELRPGKYARLLIEDDGPEYDASTVEQLFNPFCSTKGIDKGAGFGLSVVHGIAAAHGGTIGVQCKERCGMIFSIFLPICSTAPSPSNDASTRRPVESGMGKSILILDDEPDLVTLIERTLSKSGYKVHGFEKAADAIAFMRKGAEDVRLVVSDHNMPLQSGLDVAREIRQFNETTPIIIMSGYVTADLQRSAAEAGVQAVLFKENTVSKIAETIQDFMNSFS